MRRLLSDRRPDWQKTIEAQGLGFHGNVPQGEDGRPYWDESVYYAFTMPEILELERVTEDLHGMCLEAVDHVITRERYADFRIADWLHEPIRQSWKRRDPHLFGRFDLCYDGAGHAKLLEYNADTPTSLVESSVIQWHWKEDVHPACDQWNSLHEKLIDRWLHISAPGAGIHFAFTRDEEAGEDALNAAYMMETAAQAGLPTRLLAIEDIGWDSGQRRFVDLQGQKIRRLFKLYPWEWLVTESFAALAIERQARTPWVEPLWKMLLSNKALLAVLWDMYPGHPNLLPAHLDGPRDLAAYVAKPLLGREGASIRIVQASETTTMPGDYGAEGYVYQEFWPLPDFEGRRPVLGSWVIGDESAGLGIRETSGLITGNTSSFVPHLIDS
ncbi:glutathionylspermidine synthase family protein [Sphaerisporangium album]|uniref:Glutathionylspermidine synthase family protein n=1 Tax=Sphaerisporangium album TaxID=509200 RepID=A0A367FBZ9_9ACTN|nr:glutathionylspermidine synthase family protein [Sphaerisporangium album]RCG27215.1 glutathionylspermidine synthase family protein [Sphaerisporangium album]